MLMHNDTIILDGSHGEGGGQILRTALGLSALTGRPFRIEKIRAKRAKPGLMRQHLTCVNAAAAICGGRVEGAGIGAQTLSFTPGAVRPGEYKFTIGSAGSTTLVLQTILPPLMCAAAPSTITLEGGTHNPMCPPVDFIEHAFLPILARMGAPITVSLERHGFNPAGGGRWTVSIDPCAAFTPITIESRGQTLRREARAMCAGLAGEIGVRELAQVKKRLDWSEDELVMRQLPEDQGPGNVVMISIVSENATEIATGFGQRGVLAETVADGAIDEIRAYLATDAPVGVHLADQLLIPLALAGGGAFVTGSLSLHARTNMEIIERFLPVKFEIEQLFRNTRVSVRRTTADRR